MASDTLMSLPNCNLQIEAAAQPSIMTTLRSKTARARHELPPELIDRVIDFLHNDPKALAACSLVASSWIATSRYHRFSRVKLICPNDWTKLDRLVEISPTVVHYIRAVATDITNNAPSAKWTAAFTSFTSLEHITMSGVDHPSLGIRGGSDFECGSQNNYFDPQRRLRVRKRLLADRSDVSQLGIPAHYWDEIRYHAATAPVVLTSLLSPDFIRVHYDR
jgi:hypothetical protein